MKIAIDENMKKLIVSNPEILGGKPVIAGTRIPIARIIYLLKEGYTVENIADQYPHVGQATVTQVIDELITKLDNRHASQITQI